MSVVKPAFGQARRKSVRRLGRQTRHNLAVQTGAWPTAPAAPVALSPGSAAAPGPVVSNSTPTFTWQAVAGAGGYQIHIFDTTIQKFASFTVDASATSFTPAAGT